MFCEIIFSFRLFTINTSHQGYNAGVLQKFGIAFWELLVN